MDPHFDMGEIPAANLSANFVEPNPPADCQLADNPVITSRRTTLSPFNSSANITRCRDGGNHTFHPGTYPGWAFPVESGGGCRRPRHQCWCQSCPGGSSASIYGHQPPPPSLHWSLWQTLQWTPRSRLQKLRCSRWRLVSQPPWRLLHLPLMQPPHLPGCFQRGRQQSFCKGNPGRPGLSS